MLNEEKKVEEEKVETQSSRKFIAKKDFRFQFGKTVYVIKKGDEIKVPKMFHVNLKTENVL